MSTGTYALNGTDLIVQPTSGKWVPRPPLGIDGAGHPVYPLPREFELDWDLIDMDTFNQIQGFYNAVGNTGTIVATLPQYGAAQFSFVNYSGCTLGELEQSDSFFSPDGWAQKVKLVIMNIVTG